MTEGAWITFKEGDSTGKKTKVFGVFAKTDDSLIGYVKWYGPWRQYAFYPGTNTVYERQCLMDITKFIHHLMQERKLKKKLVTYH
jgi:hypothetical protein